MTNKSENQFKLDTENQIKKEIEKKCFFGKFLELKKLDYSNSNSYWDFVSLEPTTAKTEQERNIELISDFFLYPTASDKRKYKENIILSLVDKLVQTLNLEFLEQFKTNFENDKNKLKNYKILTKTDLYKKENKGYSLVFQLIKLFLNKGINRKNIVVWLSRRLFSQIFSYFFQSCSNISEWEKLIANGKNDTIEILKDIKCRRTPMIGEKTKVEKWPDKFSEWISPKKIQNLVLDLTNFEAFIFDKTQIKNTLYFYQRDTYIKKKLFSNLYWELIIYIFSTNNKPDLEIFQWVILNKK